AIALAGDIVNERSVSRYQNAPAARWHLSQDFVDSAARIEAAGSLSMSAGRDVASIGSVLDSRGDVQVNAGRDVLILSAERRHEVTGGRHYLSSGVEQFGADVRAGRDIDVTAGRDLAVIASQLDAKRDLALSVGRDAT